MKRSQLSAETDERVRLLFPPEQRDEVRTMLVEECGNNLPFCQELDSSDLDRFQFAALKLSDATWTNFAAQYRWRNRTGAISWLHQGSGTITRSIAIGSPKESGECAYLAAGSGGKSGGSLRWWTVCSKS
jgi:hypothetical protein